MDSSIPSHQSSQPSTEPDIMNDPAFDPSALGKDKGPEEPDTCRICRGEGSADEPLFYPCKCSGSIKFVHQDCLMEWLSHSQKKHCELCKTSFRWTKLYHPQMPQTVPLPIFIKQAAVHTFKSLMTWLRWNLVIFVWLGWVPWCMRTVWRGLFWVGDGGWISAQEIEKQAREYHRRVAAQGTSPAGRDLAYPTDPASPSIGFSFSSKRWPPVSLHWDFSNTEPAIHRLAKYLYTGFIWPGNTNMSSTATESRINTGFKPSQRSPSLLSEVSYLNNLTRSPTLNNMAIDVLEGQLITLLVVVVFILIFLIREWVVQQQPAILAAGQAVAEQPAAEGNRAVARNGNQPRDPDMDRARRREERERLAREFLQRRAADERQRPGAEDPDPLPVRRVHARPAPRIAGRPAASTQYELDEGEPLLFHMDPPESSTSPDSSQPNDVATPTGPSASSNSSEELSRAPSRPAPDREILARANDIRRTIEEQAMASEQNWPGIDVFMDVWKRADSNPAEVLRLIEAEGRAEELGWIVSAMKRLNENYSPEVKVNLVYEDEAEETSPSPEPSLNASALSGVNAVSKEGDVDPTKDAEGQEISLEEARLAGQPLPPPFYTVVDGSRAPHQSIRDLYQGKIRESDPLLDEVNELLGESGSHDGDGPSESNNFEVPEPQSHVAVHPESSTGRGTPVQEVTQSAVPQNGPETSQQASDGPAESPASPAPQQGFRDTRSRWEKLQDWLWGDVQGVNLAAEEDDQDGHVVHNEANGAPFARGAQGQLMIENGIRPPEEAAADPEVIEAAADAGVDLADAEAIEDREDLEGIMELIGAQGPLAGLIQNGMFSATLISISFVVGVWVPYVVGKVALVLMANPVNLLVKLPLRWSSIAADMFVDLCIFVAGCTFVWIDTFIRYTSIPVGWFIPVVRQLNQNHVIPDTALRYAWESADRLGDTMMSSTEYWAESDIPVFSIVAHESLEQLQGIVSRYAEISFNFSKEVIKGAFDESSPIEKIVRVYQWARFWTSLGIHVAATSIEQAVSAAPGIMLMNPLRISIDLPERTTPLRYELAHWSTRDRVITIFVGYLVFFLLGAAYLKLRRALRDKDDVEKDGSLVDVLNQAGGVTKVVLIISIEMILFPLYCGMLLDIALLPLFENATIFSRLRFTLDSPATSIFVHWFVGTCYMFHFALFVSMCRRILRTGVLYFIRDPDDPSFHPVRDVLERNVYTQLRKIAFSAMVYGGLVLFCLGAVVWSISMTTTGIFPIHWSSSEPVLEFPIDLLVYNFVMPIAVTLFKPSKGLNALYEWWFRKCARLLRLTHFLFGERKIDEEGWPPTDLAGGEDWPGSNSDEVNETRRKYRELAKPSGRFVRAPASDQVRLPKGSKTFVEVDVDNRRIDGEPDVGDGLHGRLNPLFSMIWIPPNFRLRISIFIVMLWLFAATTGVGCTIVPLLFGRQLFSRILPPDFRINDIYAFLIGAYLLGGPLYFAVRFRKPVVESFSRLVFSPPSVSHYRQASARGLQRLSRFSLRALRLVYFYTAFSVLLPALFAILFEVYLLIPAHTYLSAPSVHAKFALTGSPFNTTLSSNPFLQLPSSITSSLPPKSFTPQLPTNNSSAFTSVPPAPHTIHFVQDWTLGVLAIKVLAGLLLRAYPGARPSLALRALVNPGNRGAGWLNPDIRLATRGFILPALVVMLTALLVPLASGWIANFTLSALQIEGSDDPSRRALVYRFAYPFMLGSGLLFTLGRLAIIALQNWRAVVRDEVYLIGERLHNFGERKVVVGEAKQKDKGKGKERERERADSGTQTDDGPSAAIAGPSFQPENTAEELSSGMIDRAQTL